MIHPGNACTASSLVRSTARILTGCAIAALATVVGLASLPAAAQSPGQAASGSGKRAERPSGETVKQTTPGKKHGAMKDTMPVPSRTVLVFPTDGKGGVSDQVSDVITDTVRARIAASGKYQTVYFLRSLPTVVRALNESTLTNNEVSHPFDDDAKLRKLMPQTGFDMALTTSVDSYTYDAAKNQVTLLISARLIDFRGAKPVVKAAAENASSAASGGNAREIDLANQVAHIVAEKLITSLLAQ